MAYWWVNQGQTWQVEVWGGFLWSPKFNKNGSRSYYYDNMTRISVGDVVFSYFRGAISAIGLATTTAIESMKPDFGSSGANWDSQGWSVDVQFETLDSPVDPRSLLALYNQLDVSHGPMNDVGLVTQFYLFALPDSFGTALLALCAPEGVNQYVAGGTDSQYDAIVQDVSDLESDEEIAPTVRKQLGLARVGQGLFKQRVAQFEPECRITGVNSRKHLIASHMKPWRWSTDRERLDGANGLLLSPHVDHLFDRGFLTFEDSGRFVLSSSTPSQLIDRWNLGSQSKLRPFRTKQLSYLEFHRDHVFERWAG